MHDDDDNQQSNVPPELRGMFMGMLGATSHAAEVRAKIDRATNSINHEMEIEYALIAERASQFDDVLNDDHPLVTVEMAAAGFARHLMAAQVAKRLGKAMMANEPFKGHEYTAKFRMHQSMGQRWAGWVGQTTGAEHTHAEPVTAPE